MLITDFIHVQFHKMSTLCIPRCEDFRQVLQVLGRKKGQRTWSYL